MNWHVLLLLVLATVCRAHGDDPYGDGTCLEKLVFAPDVTLSRTLSEPKIEGGCDYGSLPGWWDQTPGLPSGSRWKVLTPGCQTRNLLHKHKNSTACPDGPAKKFKFVLLLGDSVDRGLLDAATAYFGLHYVRCGRIRLIQPSCGDVVFATVHLFGSSPVGPWHQNISESYREILHKAVQMDWRGSLGLPDPDLVVMNSNMWDIARALQLANRQMSDVFMREVLPQEFLDSWFVNCTAMVQYVKDTFPDALLAWHSIVPGSHNKDGTMKHFTIGKRTFVVQLNAAGRALASHLGLLLVDYEAIVKGFHDFRYLKDAHHPNEKVQLEVANLYLNLLEQLPYVPTPAGVCHSSSATSKLQSI